MEVGAIISGVDLFISRHLDWGLYCTMQDVQVLCLDSEVVVILIIKT